MTAVQWLIKELDFFAREHYFKKITTIEYHLCMEAAYNKAIDLEKNQIMDAIAESNKSNNRNVSLNPDQYYNETFKKL